MKVGIYGGSFNPVHKGHIFVAKFIKEYLQLDLLLIIPVGIPSHKEDILADSRLRFEMCKKAFAGIDGIIVSDIELKSEDVSYTYDTLLKVIKKYPNADYFEIIGEDSGENFHKWKNYQEILKLSKVVVLRRKGYKTKIEDNNIIQVENTYVDFSSTDVREKIKKGMEIKDMVPEEVEKIIFENSLYKK